MAEQTDKPQRPKRVPKPKWKVTHYLTYIKQGPLAAEEGLIEIPKNDLDDALEALPEDAFAFTISTLKQANVWIEDDLCLVGQTENLSPKYYAGGEIYSIDSIRLLRDAQARGSMGAWQDYSDLLLVMETEGHSHVIHTRTGWWQPFFQEDLHIPVDKL